MPVRCRPTIGSTITSKAAEEFWEKSATLWTCCHFSPDPFRPRCRREVYRLRMTSRTSWARSSSRTVLWARFHIFAVEIGRIQKRESKYSEVAALRFWMIFAALIWFGMAKSSRPAPGCGRTKVTSPSGEHFPSAFEMAVRHRFRLKRLWRQLWRRFVLLIPCARAAQNELRQFRQAKRMHRWSHDFAMK